MKRLMAVMGAFAMLGSTVALAADDPDEACFRRQVNAVRARPLTADDRIDRIARAHSEEMAEDETIYHNRDLAGAYEEAAGGYEYGGENVGMGPDCQSVFDAFMASPGHRENILDPDYRRLGVGVTRRGDALYVTLDFFTPEAMSRPRPRPEECR